MAVQVESLVESSTSLQQTYPDEKEEFSERAEQLTSAWDALHVKV